jgi:hypothetical protein
MTNLTLCEQKNAVTWLLEVRGSWSMRRETTRATLKRCDEPIQVHQNTARYRWPLELCWNVSRHGRHQVTWPADGGSEGFGLLWRISRNDVWCFTCHQTITCQYATDSLQQNLHSLTKMRRNDQTKHLMCPRLHIQCWWTKWMHYYYIYYMFTLSRAQAVQDRSAWRP